MKIKIEHISNTFNYGSLMMAIITINKINKCIEDLEIYIDAIREEDLNRLKTETKSNNIYLCNDRPLKSRILRNIEKLKAYRYDLIIIIGGDDLSEYYDKKSVNREMKLIRIKNYLSPIILLGQTIGPFTGKRIITAQKYLKDIKIYSRDDRCFKYLNTLGISKKVKRGGDLAFLELPYKNKGILQRYNLIEGEYITVVSSGLRKSYTSNYQNYIREHIKFIINILEKNKLHGKKVVLLPHVLLPKHVDDRGIIRDIMKNIDVKFKNRIIAIEDEMLASEARTILGKGLFTITGRMHAAVSTFYMRKPAISLSYSVKYAGVIGEGLDMNELLIESANDELWENGHISELVNEKVNYVLENYKDLVKKIDREVARTSKIVEEQLEDLVIEMKNIKSRKSK